MSVKLETSITNEPSKSSTTTNESLAAVIDEIKKSGKLGDMTILESEITDESFSLTNSTGQVILEGTNFNVFCLISLPKDSYVLALGDEKIPFTL
jgi:hypothetical protein